MKDAIGQPRGGWGCTGHAPGPWNAGNQPDPRTQNLNVVRTRRLVYPQQVKRDLPASPTATHTIVESRAIIRAILEGTDPRMLAIVGPCSIHDEQAACEYAGRLARVGSEVSDRLHVVMRVYFEKPRTTVGWKGLINDPHLDGSFDIDAGLRKARRILLHVAELGLPTATEMLDPITPQYIDDLVAWSAIGARTTESQTHRQMASGLSMPVGFKNGTDGSLQTALDALAAARHAHSFLGIDEHGLTAVIETRGNPWGHVILRGGRSGPNYHPETIAAAATALEQRKLPPRIIVDCSHANSNKSCRNQAGVWRSVLDQRVAGNHALIGLMLESNLAEGNQKLGANLADLRYGVSITDECIGWDDTEALLYEAYQQLAHIVA